MAMEGYQSFFKRVAGVDAAHGWQGTLGSSPEIRNRLICVPTGFGKTLGVLSAWAYNRIARQNEAWPRRLVWCLPMRTLVEQTVAEVERVVAPLGVNVYTVMGGKDAGEWYLHPEVNAVIVGTQDMLLSRALNRGYAAPRARWPMEFGLLNCDCLWVMDEVQLMDVGLATSAQLQQFREEDHAKTSRPSYTWWMSATLQPEWLKSVDTRSMVETIEHDILCVPESDKQSALWQAVNKPVDFHATLDEKAVAALAAERHAATDADKGRTTLVIVNTVKRAVAVYDALKKSKSAPDDIRLVHSRFRPGERSRWRGEFLNRRAGDLADRIIVATQVVEAGVDISATCLITDLAPWASLVQRFGRAARYGGKASVHVIDVEEKKTAPYAWAELEAARHEVKSLRDASIRSLDAFEASLTPERKQALYPYAPEFLLLRHEVEELFDTTPDLTGADLDISRFIRSGEETDCQIAWPDLAANETPSPDYRPTRDELCAVPIGEVRKYLEKRMAWRWDYLDRAWLPVKANSIYPGLMLVVRADAGGYSPYRGFDASLKDKVPVVDAPPCAPDADDAEEDESLSITGQWQTIAEHGKNTAEELALIMGGEQVQVLDLAARWHDYGKAHAAFRSLLIDAPSADVAKAPENAWHMPPRYAVTTGDPRPGFRHELASALAILDLLRQTAPEHAALRGPWKAFFPDAPQGEPPICDPTAVHQSLAALSANAVNLLVYLVAAHHGKVRVSLQASPADQTHPVARTGGEMPIRGILEGDELPPLHLSCPSNNVKVPPTRLTLAPAALGLSATTGASWGERCAALLAEHGPFQLAYLETLIRASDIRASRR